MPEFKPKDFKPKDFKPKTVYVTYIAATPEKVWQALTDPAFTRQYFKGFNADVEPRTGGAFFLRYPAGSTSAARSWTGARRGGLPARGWWKGSRISASCRNASSPTRSSRLAVRRGSP
jgi:hypothetical protein